MDGMKRALAKCKSFYAMLSRSIHVGERLKRNLLALTIISIFCAILGVVLIILNVVTKRWDMLGPSILTLVAGVGCAIFAGILKKRGIALIFPIAFCGVMFTYYALNGSADGTAILWALIMPIGICYFVNVRVGILMSALFAIFFFVLFYSPLSQYVAAYYEPTFLLRFPIVFLASAGFAVIAMIQYHRVALHEIDYSNTLAEEVQKQTAVAVERATRLENVTEEVVRTLARVIDAKDRYTNGHSWRVGLYSAALAEKLGWDEVEVKEMRWEGLLHDIGKIGVADRVLNKPGKLTDEEFNLIKSHTTIGYAILSESAELKSAAKAARYHHERYDGKGYPDGIKGEDIPLHARVISIADAYDAMHSDRIYRKGLSHDRIRAELEDGRGTQFDPALLDPFIELFEDGTLDAIDKSQFAR